MMNLIDTHSHLYLPEFDEDRAQVIERAQQMGVSQIVMPAINPETMNRLHAMCAAYPGYCYPMVGLHPTEVNAHFREDLASMRLLLEQHPHYYIGIGEVGLDFYWDETFKQEQLFVFEEQIKWALEFNLPLVIHARSAHQALLSILYKYKQRNLRGIFHCFSGTPQECEELLSFENFLLGIGGVLTYKKSTLGDVLVDVPLSRLVLETDSPYLAPVPHRGKRNESSFICDTARSLSLYKGVSPEEVAEITSNNVKKLFFDPVFEEKSEKQR